MFKKCLFFKMGILSTLLLLVKFVPSTAQVIRPKRVLAYYDTSAIPELFHQIPIGLKFIYSDNEKASTRGFLHGKVRWKNLKVHSPQGVIKKGLLIFNPKKVWQNNHQVTFSVSYGDTILSCHLSIPYLKSIHFNLFTDSIKRGVPYYLNVEGIFSDGRVYPLDTVKLRFYTSAGNLTKNVVTISKTDTLTKSILLKSSFKWDSTISDSVVVPVKTHIKVVKLPTQNELFRKWKKEK